MPVSLNVGFSVKTTQMISSANESIQCNGNFDGDEESPLVMEREYCLVILLYPDWTFLVLGFLVSYTSE
ncbi:hypothetical protein Pfo_015729 [Paulownia fortunei]|nr:hypothetical protein Pfo_015729 [Paulownia fortunei]